MSRQLHPSMLGLVMAAIGVLALAMTPTLAAAQSVSMSGQFHQSSGRTVNLPIDPLTPCTPTEDARCHGAGTNGGALQYIEPAEGVGVVGNAQVIPGGLGVGDTFTIPPFAFQKEPVAARTPILDNFAIIELATTFAWSFPRTARSKNPPALTRVMSAGNWANPSGGQTGRLAANTVPVDYATQTDAPIRVTYTAGPNEFGGTLAMLLEGAGRVYINGIVLGSAAGTSSTRPWLGTNPIGSGMGFRTRDGAGWDYTDMGGQPPGVIKNNAGWAAPCTQEFPPAPAGCGLVTDFTGTTIGTIGAATSTRHMFAFTTGTVEVINTGTQGGNPFNQTLTAMGYDTTSMTTGGETVRNIGLVSGGYFRRTSGSGVDHSLTVSGMNLQFVPEPGATAALIAGMGVLGTLAYRRRA